jgi:hypothetical protein
MRFRPLAVAVAFLLLPSLAAAELTKVTIASRATVADGQPFGAVGAYEKLTGSVEIALDPTDPHNTPIVDLQYAPRATDGKVHFTADLYVLRPVDAARGNGVLLFEVANRGNKLLFGYFNNARGAGGRNDPQSMADFGDGFLMREGYTIVWVGWQFDVAPPALRVDAPPIDLRASPRPDTARFSFIVDNATAEAAPGDWPRYLPADIDDAAATLTVRNRYWDAPTAIARNRWRMIATANRPRVALDDGFEPGRIYEISYRPANSVVAGVGLAALRDTASAFLNRSDLPVQGRSAYIFGASQSGRLLRQFLHDGFNVDERNRRVFALAWPHIAGAGLGSFNERFAMPGYSSFPATRFPYKYSVESNAAGTRDSILARYQPAQQPRIISTNTDVEYWGQGRMAAMVHTSLDGRQDTAIPDNVRIYLLAGTQHGEAGFPPSGGAGQQLPNPTPQVAVMHALLRAAHRWVADGVRPPDSRYPRLGDGTLVAVDALRFPAIPGVANPRTAEGPGQIVNGRFTAMPFLVPQVDADGNDLGGIRVPEVAVPLATATGWNFRAPRVGNPLTMYALLGSYIPFASTRAERQARQDPRPAIEERYSGMDDYLRKIRSAAADLITRGYLLQEDLDSVVARATEHWTYATRSRATASAGN